MVHSSIFGPLLLALFVSCLGRYLGRKGSKLLIFFWSFGLVCLNVFNLVSYIAQGASSVTFGTIIDLGFLRMSWDFLFDGVSLTMGTMISLVSTIILLYAFFYMGNDPHFNRFFTYMVFFVFFMYILVFANNVVIFFVGW